MILSANNVDHADPHAKVVLISKIVQIVPLIIIYLELCLKWYTVFRNVLQALIYKHFKQFQHAHYANSHAYHAMAQITTNAYNV